jgi:hypothetical protein
MDVSEFVNGTVDGEIDHFKPLDKDTDHRWAELGALFSIAADFPIEALEVNPLIHLHHRAIQHSCQFFVSHPNLWHCRTLVIFDRPRQIESGEVVLGINILSLG